MVSMFIHERRCSAYCHRHSWWQPDWPVSLSKANEGQGGKN